MKGRTMPLETAEQATEGQADAQITDQGAGQDQGQQVSGAQASGQQAQGATDDSADFTRVARRNYAKIAPDGDFNKVIHRATEHMDLERAGFGALAAEARKMGLSGYALLDLLQREDDAGEVETHQQAAQAAAQPAHTPQQGQQASQGYLTAAEAKQMVSDAVSQATQDWEQKQQQYRETERQRADRQAKIDAEGEAYNRYLGELGFKQNPQKVNIEGNDVELDMDFQFNVLPRLQAVTQWLVDQSIHPDDPDYHAKRTGPVDPEIVARAAAILKPSLTLEQQRTLERAADQQADLPAASLAGGPGGRAQPDPSTLTPEQAEKLAIRRARSRGLIRAEGDR